MEQINPFAAIIQSIMVLVTLAIIMGFLHKLLVSILAMLAFPTYLGLYALETQIIYRLSSGRNILSLNIPKKNPAKFIMNFCAAMITLCLIQGLERIFELGVSGHEVEQAKLLNLTFNGQLYSQEVVLIFSVAILVLYAVSAIWGEPDETDGWAKVENLSIPSLWKTVFKPLS